MTDSGSLIYRGQKKTKPAKFLNNEAEWSNILAPDIVGGAAWSDWVTYLEKFVTDYSHLMELCPDNVRRFPAHISVIVLDNLNGTNINDKSQENKKKEEDRHTLKKFLDDCKKTDETDRLMGLLDQFRSALYCQTATAEHWDMPGVVDQIANHLREKAREKKIATLSSGQFWASIQAFRGKDQLNTNVGAETGSENASGSRPVGESYAWHHFENGSKPKLPFHWDRYLFRLVCYMETSLLHESIKRSIFDMDNIKEMSTTINMELEEYRQSLKRGEDGGIPESIVPNRDQPEQVTEADLVEEAIGQAVGGSANDELMEVDYSGDANDDENPVSDEEDGENAGSQFPEADQRINMVMGPVNKVHSPDTSKLIMKKDSSGNERNYVLPPWAKDRNTAKCGFCGHERQIVLPLVEESNPTCPICQQKMLVAEDIAAEMSDTTWATNPDLMAEILRNNRVDHVLESDRAATESDKEVKAKSPQRTEGTLNKVFGHDQTGIEGFDICEKGLRNSLNEEKSERDARTEFEGAVRTKRESDAQKGDDDSQERPTLDEQDANDEGKDPHHHRPGRTEADSYLENKATMLFHKLKATIPMI